MTSGERKFDAIVCLSQIDWDFLWQRTQEIMSQYAAMGYPVLFIENTGVRVPGIKDMSRVCHRLKKALMSTQQAKIKSDNIEVFCPLALPFPYANPAIRFNAALINSRILQFSKERSIPVNKILFWSYMTTPLSVKLAGNQPWAGIIVDLVSDPCKVKGAEPIESSHKKMMEMANTVICASVPLMNNTLSLLGNRNGEKVYLVEDGFSTRLEQLECIKNEEVIFPWEKDGKPVVAYIGGINNKIWWEAVSNFANKLPEVTFVFVGPKEFKDLPCQGYRKNVFWHPPFDSYIQLRYFLQKCSVGLIPYIYDKYVSEMRPAKINEYIVMGLPIVATRLPELERFARENGSGIIYLAGSLDEFVIQIKKAIVVDSDELRQKRRQLAKENSWDRICRELEILIYNRV